MNFSIRPTAQGIYPAVCHVGHLYIPLTEENLSRLADVVEASPDAVYHALVEVVGISPYLTEHLARLWAVGDAAEQARALQESVRALEVRT